MCLVIPPSVLPKPASLLPTVSAIPVHFKNSSDYGVRRHGWSLLCRHLDMGGQHQIIHIGWALFTAVQEVQEEPPSQILSRNAILSSKNGNIINPIIVNGVHWVPLVSVMWRIWHRRHLYCSEQGKCQLSCQQCLLQYHTLDCIL